MITQTFKIGDKVAAIALLGGFPTPRPRVDGLTVTRVTFVSPAYPERHTAIAPYWRIQAEKDTGDCRLVEGAERFFVLA